jgi:SAM-dependent methyltransferase
MASNFKRSSLEGCGLDVGRDDLWKAFEPFVLPETAENTEAWRDGVKRQRKRILKNIRRKIFGGKAKVSERSTDFIKDSYGPKWAQIGYSNYDPAKEHSNYAPWLWGERHFLASTYGSARFRHLLLAALIEKLQPKSVLEVGCGNGINLLLLANRFPDVRFAGVDLTDSGPRLFAELKAAGGLPENLVNYAPLPPRDPTAFNRVDFQQGTAEHLDFADGSFDFVMSILALEQMERIRHKALSEMARVAAKWTLMIEPFRDVNPYLWPRLNIIRQDYFQGRIADLPDLGLEPILVTDDFPQEIHLRACLTLCRKQGSAQDSEALAAQ